MCVACAGRTLAVDWSHRSRAHNEAAAEAGDEEAAAAMEMARRVELSWMSGEKAEAIEKVSRTRRSLAAGLRSVDTRSSIPRLACRHSGCVFSGTHDNLASRGCGRCWVSLGAG